jgi:hypothetical protein
MVPLEDVHMVIHVTKKQQRLYPLLEGDAKHTYLMEFQILCDAVKSYYYQSRTRSSDAGRIMSWTMKGIKEYDSCLLLGIKDLRVKGVVNQPVDFALVVCHPREGKEIVLGMKHHAYCARDFLLREHTELDFLSRCLTSIVLHAKDGRMPCYYFWQVAVKRVAHDLSMHGVFDILDG